MQIQIPTNPNSRPRSLRRRLVHDLVEGDDAYQVRAARNAASPVHRRKFLHPRHMRNLRISTL